MQALKAVGVDNLSGCSLKDGARFLSKLMVTYVIFQLPLKSFLSLVRQHKPLPKKVL